jgi:hypothetical protein
MAKSPRFRCLFTPRRYRRLCVLAKESGSRHHSREQIEDALAICFAFNTINRLADAFEFSVPGPNAFAAGARYLLARGYR